MRIITAEQTFEAYCLGLDMVCPTEVCVLKAGSQVQLVEVTKLLRGQGWKKVIKSWGHYTRNELMQVSCD